MCACVQIIKTKKELYLKDNVNRSLKLIYHMGWNINALSLNEAWRLQNIIIGKKKTFVTKAYGTDTIVDINIRSKIAR